MSSVHVSPNRFGEVIGKLFTLSYIADAAQIGAH
jgi:hypothetical protein